jgi:hypothetical protein
MGTEGETTPARYPSLDRLYEYWRELRGERYLPARQDLDPLEIPYILGRVALIDVREGADRYRVRLYGTRLAIWLGFDLTGKRLADCPDREFGRLVAEACDTVIAEGLPRWERFTWQHGEARHSCGVFLLPLGDDGAGIDTVMLAMMSEASEAAN